MSEASNRDGSGPEQPQARVSLFGRRAKLRSPSESLQPQAAPPPPAPPADRRRHEGLSRLSGLLSFVLIGAFLGLAGFAWAMSYANKAGPLTADKVVVISREDETEGGAIADQLSRAGVIDSPLMFNLTVLVDGNRGKLRRGEYLFKEGASLRDVEGVLVSGKVVLHKVTVPEGLTSDQVVQRLRANDVFVGDIKEIPREGSILPETYEFERGVPRAKVLSVMEQAQAKIIDEIWKQRSPDLPIKSPGELVTLASIVEKETGRADERAHVAGVFINRLQKRMKLESDPTIVYGLVGGKGTLGHSISKSELAQATPYNTYIIPGLPPGPITNPGKAALEAVANPSPTKDLYFVADGTGGHAFADTLEQHLKNVQHWREIEKDAKDRLAPDAVPIVPAPASAPAKVHGARETIDPKALGGLTAPAVAKPSAASANLARRLAKLGADRQTRQALLGPSGALSTGAVNLEQMGLVVQGVNDQQIVSQDVESDDSAATTGPVSSYPLSAAALADQQSRAARYGDAGASPNPRAANMLASADPPASHAGPRPRAFDASEGTPLDPLLNTTYDLDYPKVIPTFK
ncbi:MAG: endolytic transglycosylase MltG [Roseiarcus sp.]